MNNSDLNVRTGEAFEVKTLNKNTRQRVTYPRTVCDKGVDVVLGLVVVEQTTSADETQNQEAFKKMY